jgi:hypothetical protein
MYFTSWGHGGEKGKTLRLVGSGSEDVGRVSGFGDLFLLSRPNCLELGQFKQELTPREKCLNEYVHINKRHGEKIVFSSNFSMSNSI